ncbi:winged helix-turn-helix domain-containing protein [Sulfurimonas sp.]|uniref:winged helix-turn-helix domain-containing protein n=1 Tax=Sulfurimonas sp. TaxID=2022749 RepID=UPI00356402DF
MIYSYMQKQENTEYKIGGQIWVQKNAENFMGPGRVALLEKLSEGCSISRAAESLGMDYTTAVKNIIAINKVADKPLVINHNDEHFEVTRYGNEIIKVYLQLKEEHTVFLEKLNKTFEEKLTKIIL